MTTHGLYLITGAAGSGKSTIGEYLSNIGHKVVEGNDNAQWVHKESGSIVPRGKARSTDATWVDQHYWNWQTDAVTQIVEDARQQTIFLTGGADNIIEYWPLFTAVFVLTIDDATTEQRIMQRTSHDYGKGEGQLAQINAWKEELDTLARQRNATRIDAHGSVEDVANSILGQL